MAASWSKTQQALPPSSLARYIAASAALRIGSAGSPGALMATPMLAETLASSLARRNGSATRRRIRSATASASVLRPSPSHSTANSSPPMRATVSPGRTLADSRTAAAASRSWPAR